MLPDDIDLNLPDTQHRLPARTRRTYPWILRKLRHDKHLRNLLIAILFMILTAAGLIVWMRLNTVEYANDNSTVHARPKPVVYHSPLTGNAVPDEAATKQLVTAIMIENSPDARPQSGLQEAGIVYEAIAEGGITRFLALYQESKPGLIGPVRSLRPYYVEWAHGYDPSVAHVGGSFRALQMIRSGNYGRDIDQFFNSGAYWRANDRYAPHNVYTDFAHLDELNRSKGYTASNFTGFLRVDAEPSEQPDATVIDLDISSPTYDVNYQYDPTTNTYLRSLGGEPHMDRERGRIAPSAVIAIRVPNELVFEDGYRESYQVVGSGQAYLFQNGKASEITWHKSASGEPLILRDAQGAEVPVVRGQTWVTAVEPERAVTWR